MTTAEANTIARWIVDFGEFEGVSLALLDLISDAETEFDAIKSIESKLLEITQGVA